MTMTTALNHRGKGKQEKTPTDRHHQQPEHRRQNGQQTRHDRNPIDHRQRTKQKRRQDSVTTQSRHATETPPTDKTRENHATQSEQTHPRHERTPRQPQSRPTPGGQQTQQQK